MAQSARRVNSRSERLQASRQTRYTYEDGNAVRVPEWLPPEIEDGEQRRSSRRKSSQKNAGRKKPAQQTGRKQRTGRRTASASRARERSVGVGYVLFLTAVCFVTVFFCIYYLQLKSELTTQNTKIVALESNLSQLQADNDAYYKKAMASVSMDEVRETAIDKLGMHYPSKSQIRYYSTDDNSYVRQYRDVP